MVDRIVQSAIRSAVNVTQITGNADVIQCTATLPMIILDFTKSNLIGIEIRRSKEELGWLYTLDDKTHVVFIKNNTMLWSTTIEAFRKHMEDRILSGGKTFSDSPEVGKLHRRDDGAVLTYLSNPPSDGPSD